MSSERCCSSQRRSGNCCNEGNCCETNNCCEECCDDSSTPQACCRPGCSRRKPCISCIKCGVRPENCRRAPKRTNCISKSCYREGCKQPPKERIVKVKQKCGGDDNCNDCGVKIHFDHHEIGGQNETECCEVERDYCESEPDDCSEPCETLCKPAYIKPCEDPCATKPKVTKTCDDPCDKKPNFVKPFEEPPKPKSKPQNCDEKQKFNQVCDDPCPSPKYKKPCEDTCTQKPKQPCNEPPKNKNCNPCSPPRRPSPPTRSFSPPPQPRKIQKCSCPGCVSAVLLKYQENSNICTDNCEKNNCLQSYKKSSMNCNRPSPCETPTECNAMECSPVNPCYQLTCNKQQCCSNKSNSQPIYLTEVTSYQSACVTSSAPYNVNSNVPCIPKTWSNSMSCPCGLPNCQNSMMIYP